jgi:GNAT superfamily N-acetyltransferase
MSTILPDGERIVTRPLRVDDDQRLGAYLESLSEATRSLWAPHPFEQATADQICASLSATGTLRIVSALRDGSGERIIGYMVLEPGCRPGDRERYARQGIRLDQRDASFAPCVADEFQNRGVGSVMMERLFPIARQLGIRRVVLWGGVQARNERAIGFYRKWGFRKVGAFFKYGLDNDDMLLNLVDVDDAVAQFIPGL